MANMGYCRFENTLKDLWDCMEALQDAGSLEELQSNVSSVIERNSMESLVELCGDIYHEFSNMQDCGG